MEILILLAENDATFRLTISIKFPRHIFPQNRKKIELNALPLFERAPQAVEEDFCLSDLFLALLAAVALRFAVKNEQNTSGLINN